MSGRSDRRKTGSPMVPDVRSGSLMVADGSATSPENIFDVGLHGNGIVFAIAFCTLVPWPK